MAIGTKSRPRVLVTLDWDVLETVGRVARLQGRSKSALVRELVTELEPGLRRLADLGEAYESLEEQQRETLRRAVFDADERLGEPLQAAVTTAVEALQELDSLARAASKMTPPR